jgi:hypothetical protein
MGRCCGVWVYSSLGGDDLRSVEDHRLELLLGRKEWVILGMDLL